MINEELHISLSPAIKALIEETSQKLNISISHLITQMVLEKALKIEQSENSLYLNQQEWDNALNILNSEAHPQMEALFTRGYRATHH